MAADNATETSERSHGHLKEAQRGQLRELIYRSMSCEFASIRDRKPSVVPLTPFYDTERGLIVVSSPLAYAGKVTAVEDDPRVSMLLHDSDGEYLVTGDATVRADDPEANAAYIHRLSESEPPTPKRAANEAKHEFLESRLGNALLGWAGKRAVIEIDPISMARVADGGPITSLPAWPAAEMSRREAREYERAALAAVGETGYPEIQPVTSIRVDDGTADVEPEIPTTVGDGQPACLLFHWHNDAGVYR